RGGGPDRARTAPGVVDRAGHGLPGGRAAARGRRGRPTGAGADLPRPGPGRPRPGRPRPGRPDRAGPPAPGGRGGARPWAGRGRGGAGGGWALGGAGGRRGRAGPAVPVLAVLFAARRGWRAAGWFTAAVLGAGLVTDGLAVAAHPAAVVVNTVLYPLGLAKAASPAASMLPGHLLASFGTWGHWTALALMALAGTGVGLWLIIRPPRDARGAGWRLALGLALLFVLAPASRVGYFVSPLGLAAWLLLSRWPGLRVISQSIQNRSTAVPLAPGTTGSSTPPHDSMTAREPMLS